MSLHRPEKPQLNFEVGTRDCEMVLNRLLPPNYVVLGLAAADLGSGSRGHSTIALKTVVPSGTMIHTVDCMWRELDPGSLGQLPNHYHHYTGIHDFLANAPPGQLGVAQFCAVPDHNLQIDNGYHLLSTAIAPGGVVIEMGDTCLDHQMMNATGFTTLNKWGNFAKSWIKRNT